MGLRAPGAAMPAQPAMTKPKLPEFDVQRQKVQQRGNAAAQGQQDAMSRRFAANGMLNSGAALKQQNLIGQEAQRNTEEAIQSVDAAEMGEQQRRQEIVDQRDFASNEAKLGRDFAGSESALQRAQQGSQFDRSFTQQGSQFDKNFGLQNKQFAADRLDQDFNKSVAGSQMKGGQLDRFNEINKGMGRQGLAAPQKVQPQISMGKYGATQDNPFQRRMG